MLNELNESHCDYHYDSVLLYLNKGKQSSCQPLLLCCHGLTTSVCLRGCVACRLHVSLIWF